MALVGIVFGLLLILLGGGAYLTSGGASVTALIPAFVGLPVLILGVLARNPARTKAAMHGAVGLALLGLLGSARGIPDALALLQGQDVERPTAAVVQATMAVLCLVFLVLGVRSFIQARKARG